MILSTRLMLYGGKGKRRKDRANMRVNPGRKYNIHRVRPAKK